MSEAIDYSRPVGWWCPVCCTADGYVGRLIRRKPRERKQKHYCLDDEGNRLRKTPIASCVLALVDHYQKEALGADTLRARVAELEAELERTWKHLRGLNDDYNGEAAAHLVTQEREAQHLADIKALRSAAADYVSLDYDDEHEDAKTDALVRLQRELEILAHYDDAKADAPAFESWCYDVGGGAAADDGAVCKAHDAEGGEG